ncbi:hypothetical protein V7S43_005378 [Phytophthora oleae]|uniref:Uncharacterized protein n=1 Tax=Phytophthora oleae TaxID=2107226 RepID=A0ABD3FST2_9STRA
MTADEVLLLCALLDDAGCSGATALAIATLYKPLVERPVVPNIRFRLVSMADADAEYDFRFDVARILRFSSYQSG